jgi:hypothetical protein
LLTDFPLTDFPLTDVPLTDFPGASQIPSNLMVLLFFTPSSHQQQQMSAAPQHIWGIGGLLSSFFFQQKKAKAHLAIGPQKRSQPAAQFIRTNKFFIRPHFPLGLRKALCGFQWKWMAAVPPAPNRFAKSPKVLLLLFQSPNCSPHIPFEYVSISLYSYIPKITA